MSRAMVGAAVALAVAVASAPTAAVASTGGQSPYVVSFTSTIVSTYMGHGSAPSGTEKTEIQATIPLTGSGAPYTGSAQTQYAQATGTITGTCSENSVTGTTTETETGGNPSTFTASYTPGSGTVGGAVQLDIGSLTTGPSENFREYSSCTGLTTTTTGTRFLNDFLSDHNSALILNASAPADELFSFPLSGGSSSGPAFSAGSYTFTGGATIDNVSYAESTTISVSGNDCVVPNVTGQSQSAAESSLTGAACTVGGVTTQPSSSAAGTVISSSPAAGATLSPGATVALVVSSGPAASPSAGAGANAGSTSTQLQPTLQTKSCDVPNVKGKTLAAARKAIAASSCAVGKVTRRKTGKRHVGKVLSESLGAGSSHPAGTKVGVVVGK